MDNDRNSNDALAMFCVLGAVVSLLPQSEAQQQPPDPPPPGPVGGQWTVPFELDLEQATYVTHEIAHGIVLPPPDGALTDDRVLFVAENLGGCAFENGPPGPCTFSTAGRKYGRAYVWRPSVPANTASVLVPLEYPQDGSQDLFCGGHNFVADGTLLWVCGTDSLAQCQICSPSPHGHDFAWSLDTRAPLPSWSSAGVMDRKRWYPTALLMADNTVRVTGHVEEPHDGGSTFTDIFDPVTGWLPEALPNLPWDAACSSVPLMSYVNVGDYPRLHLLSDGFVIQSNPLVGHAGVVPTRYLDVQFPACPDGPRWRSGVSETSNAHVNGSSVHFIVWNGDIQFPEFTDVVYAIGGGKSQITEECGGDPTDYFSTAEKLVVADPPWTSAWDTSVPDLNYTRVNHNAVILLDGSILVIGGAASNGTECVSRMVPELYKPPELFGNPNEYWKSMAQQAVDRRYHSVAGLLRDGRVYSAGGKNVADECTDPEDPDCASDHSVELYSPPYMIRGARPVIDADTVKDPTDTTDPVNGGHYGYGQEIDFEVTLPPNTLVGRAALIRNGVATHAFDSNQRYVQLAWTVPPEALGNNRWRIRALVPQDGYMAPPGYYFLTVVSSTQMPSLGVWVRIDQP